MTQEISITYQEYTWEQNKKYNANSIQSYF